MITYNKEKRIFKLDTKNTTYMMGVVDDEGFLGHVYYGNRITDDGVDYLLRIFEMPYVPSQNSRDRGSFLDTFPTEYAGSFVGDFREGSIKVRDKNGHEAVQLTYKSHEIMSGKPKLKGLPATFPGDDAIETLAVKLADDTLNLEAVLYYSVFEKEDCIVRSITVKNKDSEPVHLTKIMSMTMDMDSEDFELLTLYGSWARERQIDIRPLGYGKTGIGSFRGESSHQFNPFMALVDKNSTQDLGRVYGFSFVYSGNFTAQVEKSQFDSLRVMMGISPECFDFELKKDEEFVAPEVVMTFSNEGLGRMTRNYHDMYRQHLIRSPYKDRMRPVLINNWEATYFDFDTEKLLAIAREAKAVGIEMLVMDDGWFGRRSDDNSSLGDWWVNEDKLKGGLKYLVDEVNKIGLKFGIWMEPEMISPDSDLYREHPDWAIALPDRTPTRSRNQFVLDLSRPEVVDYVYNCISSVLKSANIEYLKWDMNRQITDPGSLYLGRENQGELSHRYVLAVYELQERLVRDFPELLLENCSGGGARFDPGMLYYSPQIWCSDDTDAIERLKIQEGTSLVYPLSSMGAHVSDCPNHTVGRTTPFKTRGDVALLGTFGYELDVTRIPAEDVNMIPAQIENYHRFSDLVRQGDYYRLASYSENRQYDCVQIVSKDKSESIVVFVQVTGRPNYHSRNLRLKGLDPKRIYKVEAENEEVATLHGDTLMNAGLMIANPWGDNVSILIWLRS